MRFISSARDAPVSAANVLPVPQIVDVDVAGQASPSERGGPGLREVARRDRVGELVDLGDAEHWSLRARFLVGTINLAGFSLIRLSFAAVFRIARSSRYALATVTGPNGGSLDGPA
jgi:hypothetical protein